MTVAAPDQAVSINAPSYWAHWVLKTPRSDRLAHWYQTVFGARVAFRNERLTFLTWDGEHHRVAVIRMPWIFGVLDPMARIWRKFRGVDHISFNFGTLRHLLEVYERLRVAGIEPVWAINHGPTTSIYYDDPDGNRLEFQVENFDSVAELTAFGESGAFADNPIGVEFDPAYLLERLRAGVTERTLKMQGSGTRPGNRTISGYKAVNWRTL